MFRPKKTIPSLAGAILALTSCGGEGGSTRNTLTGKAYEAFCLKVANCNPDASPEDYCPEYTQEYDFVAQYLTSDCDALFASYFSCLATLDCQTLGSDDYGTSCDLDSEDAMVLACAQMSPVNRR